MLNYQFTPREEREIASNAQVTLLNANRTQNFSLSTYTFSFNVFQKRQNVWRQKTIVLGSKTNVFRSILQNWEPKD